MKFSLPLQWNTSIILDILMLLREAEVSLKLKTCNVFTETNDNLGYVLRPWRLTIESHTTDTIKEIKERRALPNEISFWSLQHPQTIHSKLCKDCVTALRKALEIWTLSLRTQLERTCSDEDCPAESDIFAGSGVAPLRRVNDTTYRCLRQWIWMCTTAKTTSSHNKTNRVLVPLAY